MEVKALARGVRVQPRKVRIIAAEVRGKSATHAVHLLRYHSSKGARELRKVLMSAIANAQENNNLSPETLEIAAIVVDEGPRLKRLRARAMGRANRIIKKSSHITVVVKDVEPSALVKAHGTKAKARPKFGAPPKGKKTKVETPAAVEIVEETADVEVADLGTDAVEAFEVGEPVEKASQEADQAGSEEPTGTEEALPDRQDESSDALVTADASSEDEPIDASTPDAETSEDVSTVAEPEDETKEQN